MLIYICRNQFLKFLRYIVGKKGEILNYFSIILYETVLNLLEKNVMISKINLGIYA